MKIFINPCLAGEWWSSLVEQSHQGSIFNDKWYLDSLATPYQIFKVENEAGHLLAGFCILEDRDKEEMAPIPYPFTPYQGILFSSSISSMVNHKRIGMEFKITDAIVHKLIDLYGNFNMSLSPNFSDIRPFLWFNYGNLMGDKFTVNNRFTSILNLTNFNIENYLLNIRAVRRQEYRKNVNFSATGCKIEEFLTLYKETFLRQNISIESETISLVERITQAALQNKVGSLSKISIGGEDACANLFIHSRSTSYYLFGANNPKYRTSGASTALMIESVKRAAKRGSKFLDFVGVNSPNRGDYKLSFGGNLNPYYQVTLDKT
jgi:Acetyltransferase (GNAT) domain